MGGRGGREIMKNKTTKLKTLQSRLTTHIVLGNKDKVQRTLVELNKTHRSLYRLRQKI